MRDRKSVDEVLLMLALLALSGCSVAQHRDAKDVGGVSVVLQRPDISKFVDVSAPAWIEKVARVQEYRVRIDAEDFDQTIDVSFSGDARDGVIEDVPAGRGRRVSVVAHNALGQVIFAAERSDVDIRGGQRNDVVLTLEAVPVIVNVRKGAMVERSRFSARVFCADRSPLHVWVESASSDLTASVAAMREVRPDMNTGVAVTSPQPESSGAYELVARNISNGREQRLSMHLYDGSYAVASLVAAGSPQPKSILH